MQYLKQVLDLVQRNYQDQVERRQVIAEVREIRDLDELHRLMVVMIDTAAFAVENERHEELLELLDPTSLPTVPA